MSSRDKAIEAAVERWKLVPHRGAEAAAAVALDAAHQAGHILWADEERGDWTAFDGRSNSSPEFLDLIAVVERIIRNSAHDLIAGRSATVARTIMAQLAHEHGVGPRGHHDNKGT